MSRTVFAAGTAAAALLSSTAAHAGGIERSVLNVSPLFEEGRYLEFSFSAVSPELTGKGGNIPDAFSAGPLTGPLTGETNDLLDSYQTFAIAYKADINDRLSYAVIANQPYGADTDYGAQSGSFPDVNFIYGGSFADLDAYAITALLAYDANPNVKIYGGPVFQSIEASAALPFIPATNPPNPAILGYEVEADQDWGFGYVVGAAYERPEIALRVALTYRSSIEHELDTTETLADGLATFQTQTTIETPQSLTLDFQTGIMEDTAIFGQINWVDWSDFEIAPPTYPLNAIGRPLVAYSDDWWTYTLGVARRFDENWVGLASVTYEPGVDTELTSLGPVDGRTGINLGATYENEKVKITGGINYSWLGDTFNVLNTDYDDGTSVGIGFRVGFKL